MGIQDESDKDGLLAHFAELLSKYTDMVTLVARAQSGDVRAMATDMANRLGTHLWEDLVFLVKGPESDILDGRDEDFQKWAQEMNQS